MLSCIQACMPLLRKSKYGKIINISSAAACFPIPFQAFYSASKSAVNLLSMSLANELSSFSIGVCAVMPGDVRTNFTAARQKEEQGTTLYGNQIQKSIAVMEKDEQNGMSPKKVASRLFQIACKKKIKPLYAVGTSYQFLLFLQRFLPSRFVNMILKKMYMP